MPISDGNPQLENGFTRIANELQVALAKAMAQGIITGKERAIVDWIIRYTYGFHEKNGYFHTSFIAKSLELSMSRISHILSNLEQKKIIIRKGIEIKINKHYLEWSKQNVVKGVNVVNSVNKSCQPCQQGKPKQQQIETDIIGKKINYKDNLLNIDNSTISIKENTLESSKQNERVDSQSVAKVKGSEMQELIKVFCQEMGYAYNSISIKLNVKPAKELLQTYTIDEVIEAVKYGKRKYEKEKRDPKTFITNLQAVLNSIIPWRSGFKEEIEIRERNKKGGYVI